MEMRALCLALCSCCVLVMPLKQSTVQSPSKLSAECGRQVILNCPITHGANYLRITWYKLVNNTPHTMLMRSDGKKDSLKADDDGKFQMDANESLIIREVQVEDAGMYRCSLRAPVGHQNMDMDSNLIVPECPTTQTPTSYATLRLDPSIIIAPNSTCCPGKSIPVIVPVLGFLLLNLAKALASCIVSMILAQVLKHRMAGQTKMGRLWKV
ncbi:uncharacterized protein [Ambystoma mexicanum]|uniref:uncharacterized protein isoform X1 n=1 Tax=Ambystoma mexicanum TaxID=8296 RepID=UPI0037E7C043